MFYTRLGPERSNEGAYLVKSHAEVSPILAQQASLNELRPGQAAIASWLAAYHGRVTALPTPTAL